MVKCTKERKKENPFALWSFTLSAKLNAVSVPRVGMYIGVVSFSLQICRVEDLPKEYRGIAQVSVRYPPGQAEQSTGGHGRPGTVLPQLPEQSPGKWWKGSVVASLGQPFRWFLLHFCRAHEVHSSFLSVIMVLGSRNACFSGHLHWVVLNSV